MTSEKECSPYQAYTTEWTKEYIIRILSELTMHGANNKTELRATELRGLLRYWWRTLQQDKIENHHALLQRETMYFGGSKSKKIDISTASPIIFRLSEVKNEKEAELKIHIRKQNKLSASIEDPMDIYDTYIRYMFMLSGFGKQGRKGHGALQIDQWKDVDHFLKELNCIFEKLKLDHYKPDTNTHGSDVVMIKKDIVKPTSHLTLQFVCLGPGYDDYNDARTKAEKAYKIGKKIYGKLVQGNRYSSPFHCTVRQFGEKYHPIVSAVFPDKYADDKKYNEAKQDLCRLLKNKNNDMI
ncbi:type III-B CRISPR module RAMP protein Cmr1 [Longirhabdus pacifica]|uniref:type III-B CRISPR module RAMP protein Cmr1 n=1 Tax=Longirhabdus pacifica TaxID=2305227 RepID=UPI00100914F4|nr:type III-B CRISPR module RAMP protein Cmr1 [Longirhabdus pacifica]